MLVIKKHNNGYLSKNSEMKNIECLQTQFMTNSGGFCSQSYSTNAIVMTFCLRKYRVKTEYIEQIINLKIFWTFIAWNSS